jgi:predicted phage tail protein
MNAFVRLHNLKPYGPQGKWNVKIVDHPTEAHLKSPLRMQELHIVPAFTGGGGVFKVVLGVVLIVVGAILTYTGIGAAAAPYLYSMGASMILGGIIELLTPAPKVVPNVDTQSQYLGSPKNTVAVNTPIPIGYGRFLLFGQILSFRMEADAGQINGQAPSDSQRYVGTS